MALQEQAEDTTIIINEVHNDITGTDADKSVEVVGPSGTDLTGWTLVFYNGRTDADLLNGGYGDDNCLGDSGKDRALFVVRRSRIYSSQ